jgi:alkylation response protein AidB-like acyl-CoA dehydrogenase
VNPHAPIDDPSLPRARQLAGEFAGSTTPCSDADELRHRIRRLVDAGLTRPPPVAPGDGAMPRPEVLELVRTVATGCPRAATCLAVHHSVLAAARCHPAAPLAAALLAAAATGGYLWAPFPAPLWSAGQLLPQARARTTGAEVVIEGAQDVCAGAATASHLFVLARGEHGPGAITGFILRQGTPAPQPWRPPTNLCTRRGEAVVVPAAALLTTGPSSSDFLLAMQIAGQQLFAAVVVGAAERAYRASVADARSGPGDDMTRPATRPGVQFRIGDMRARLQTMAALLTAGNAPVIASPVSVPACATAQLAAAALCRVHALDEAHELLRAAALVRSELTAPPPRSCACAEPGALAALPLSADECAELIGKTRLGIELGQLPRWS